MKARKETKRNYFVPSCFSCLRALHNATLNNSCISIKSEGVEAKVAEVPFSVGKGIALPFGIVKVKPLRGFGKNLHPSGSIFPENLDNPGRAILFARKRELPCQQYSY